MTPTPHTPKKNIKYTPKNRFLANNSMSDRYISGGMSYKRASSGPTERVWGSQHLELELHQEMLLLCSRQFVVAATELPTPKLKKKN